MDNASAKLLAAGVVLLAASPVLAQPAPSLGWGMIRDPCIVDYLNNNRIMRDDLKVTDGQQAALKKVAAQYGHDLFIARMGTDYDRKTRDAKKAAGDAAEKVLTPDQVKRLRQIKLQMSGLYAFQRDDVAAALKLNDRQKKDLAGRCDKLEKEVKDLLQSAQDDPTKTYGAAVKTRRMVQDALGKALDGLNEDQKKAWTDLVGEKCDPYSR